MSRHDTRKKVLAKRLGVSERVLEQYLELKQAEINEESTDWMHSRRDEVNGTSLSTSDVDSGSAPQRKQKDSKRRLGRGERRVSEGSSG